MTDSRRKLEQAIVGALQNNNVNDDSASEICQLVAHGRYYKEALEILKEPIKKVKPLMQARALALLGHMIKVGEIDLAVEVATVRWMDRLIKVAKTKDDIVRSSFRASQTLPAYPRTRPYFFLGVPCKECSFAYGSGHLFRC